MKLVNRSALSALTLLLGLAGSAGAQIIRPQIRSNPVAYVTLGLGWLRQQGFCDKASGDCWDFGNAPQWRASFELPLGYGGSGYGIVYTRSKVPLIYNGTGLSSNSCLRCDADANVSQLMGVFRMSGGTGFHQVIDVAVGGTMFSNFRATDGTALGTGKSTSRFTADIAYGFGYGLSNRTEIFLEQEYGLIILPRVAGSNQNTVQQQTLRIGGRIGLGDKH